MPCPFSSPMFYDNIISLAENRQEKEWCILKRTIFFVCGIVCVFLTIAGAGYIYSMGGETTGAYAFIPLFAAIYFFANATDMDKNDKEKKGK